MTTKVPDQTGPNFTSAEYAQQWQRGIKMRSEGSEAATEMMLKMAQTRESDRVLEIAAGTGDLAVITARRVGSNGYVLATDLSASMVNLTAQTAREAGVTNIETLVMDADNLDLPEASFNAALCRSALMNFPNPIKTLAGVHRALKPSGKFAVTVFSTPEKNPYHSIPLITASRLAKLPFSPSGEPGMFALSGSGVLEEYYTKAGFRDVEIRSVSVERHFSSLKEAIKAMQGSFPRLQALLKKLNESDHEIAWKEIEQQLSRFDGSHGFTAPGEWLVAVGTK
jgi:ubiquinone/menaquinone biosynthesis C-methylase UbiE